MRVLINSALTCLSISLSLAQPKDANYDETKVPAYTLPPLLTARDGSKVATARQWEERRRPEILRLFETHMYGRSPAVPAKLNFEIAGIDEKAMGGFAIRKEVTVQVTGPAGKSSFSLLLWLPSAAQAPVPFFLGLNFNGNQGVQPDSAIALTSQWVRNNPELGITANKANEKTRGIESKRWPVKQILDRGYGVGAIYYGDFDPDFDDGYKNGMQPLFYKPGQTKPGPEEWGSIAVWAWGLSRALDYLETDKRVDAKRVALVGHSRLGKAALWAGAQDPRFAAVISNDSGEGGAAISRRKFGETVKHLNTSFPHWFNENYKSYNGREETLPLDQHMLLALIAPRPLYVASAAEDLWADPRGEYLALYHAGPVYRLYGKTVIANEAMPDVHAPIQNALGHHIRAGKHDITEYDWQRFMDWADKHLKR